MWKITCHSCVLCSQCYTLLSILLCQLMLHTFLPFPVLRLSFFKAWVAICGSFSLWCQHSSIIFSAWVCERYLIYVLRPPSPWASRYLLLQIVLELCQAFSQLAPVGDELRLLPNCPTLFCLRTILAKSADLPCYHFGCTFGFWPFCPLLVSLLPLCCICFSISVFASCVLRFSLRWFVPRPCAHLVSFNLWTFSVRHTSRYLALVPWSDYYCKGHRTHSCLFFRI